MAVQGRAWLFGDNLNADQIMPVHHSRAEQERYTCLQSVRPEFSRGVRPGDILVAGRHCGIGSSRPAPRILKYLGVGAVVAESFSGIFFRNAIAIGFPVIEVRNASRIFQEGETLQLELEKGQLIRADTGEVIRFQPYPALLQEIILHGGIQQLLRAQKA